MNIPGVITKEQAIKQILFSLGLDTNETKSFTLKQVIIAEYLRKSLYCLSQSVNDQFDFEPVYIRRLTNIVRNQLIPLWPELNQINDERPSVCTDENDDNKKDIIYHILDILDNIGDAVNLGEGYWLPTPLRLVEIPPDVILIVGSLSTKNIVTKLQIEPEIAGISRAITKKTLRKELYQDPTLWQSLDEWLGDFDIASSIKEWTRDFLLKTRKLMKPSASNLIDFDVYVPYLQKTKSQNFRWILNRNLPKCPEDIVLCRFKQEKTGIFAYCLGRIQYNDNQYCLTNEYLIDWQEAIKLQYGFDLIYGSPTQVTVERCDGEYLFKFKNWLPRTEQKIFSALGKEVSEHPGQLPQYYRVSAKWLSSLEDRISFLGIEIRAV